MRNLRLFGLVFAFVVYVLIGGGVFHLLEYAEEEKIRQEVFKMHKDVDDMKRNTTEGMENTCLQPTTTQRLLNNKLGLNPKKDAVCEQEGASCISVESLEMLERIIINRLKGKLKNLTAGKDCIQDDDIPVMIMSRRQFERHINEAHLAGQHGIDPTSTDTNSTPLQWSFSAAVGFSLTVVTTIGYGHIAPSTVGGRVFCVVYALIGIPLYLVILDGVGALLGKMVRRIAMKAHVSRKWSVKRVGQLAWAITFAIGLCLFYLLPAVVVSFAEDWTFTVSLYYMFISLSTIGFGDFVAGKEKGREYWTAYKPLMFIWITCGLVFLAMVFNLVKRGIESIDSNEQDVGTGSDKDSGTCEDQEVMSMGTISDHMVKDGQKKEQVRPTTLAIAYLADRRLKANCRSSRLPVQSRMESSAMRKVTLLILLVVFVGYIFAGGGIFHWLEAHEEEKMRAGLFKTQDELLYTLARFVGSHDIHGCHHGASSEMPSPDAPDLDCPIQDCVASENVTRVLQSVVTDVNKRGQNLTSQGKCIDTIDMPLLVLTHRQLDDIILKAHQAGRRGLNPLSTQQNSSPPQWSFIPAVGFSLTLVTTIGYGNIAPSTWAGKALCVVYGLIGIPIYLVLIDGLGRLPGGLVRDLAVRVYISKGWNAKTVRRIIWFCLFTFGLFLFYLLPALVISLVENWSYPESLYYMFVSLSTIGFGDYVAGVQIGKSYWVAYKILIFFWIASGLAFLAMVFDLLKRGIQGLDEPDKTEFKLPKTNNRRQEKALSNGTAGQAQADTKSEKSDYVYENMAMDKMQ
ncbi:uncharacterized protein LOC144872033 [Branchiostoma floridae x Branchiostoma japonicum]